MTKFDPRYQDCRNIELRPVARAPKALEAVSDLADYKPAARTDLEVYVPMRQPPFNDSI
jgi:hypothetical protein